MKKSKQNASMLVVSNGLIAALYVVLTYLSSVFNLAYGPIQFRLSEALTILPVFTPAVIPGLVIGCFLGNLGSPYGIIDILCGTLATLLAAFATYCVRNIKVKDFPILAPLMPVLFNALIIGAEIAFFLPAGTRWMGFLLSALQVGAGEIVVCFVLGFFLYKALHQTKLNQFFKSQ